MARQYTDASVKTLGGLAHMRKHAGMWSFQRDTQRGLFQMVKEVFDNSVDEASIDPSNIHTLSITFLQYGSSYQVILEDTGRGIPLNKLHDSFMRLFTSGKDNEAYEKTIGAFGVGVKGTTALSRRLCAISNRGEGSAIVTAHQAECVHSKVVTAKNKDKSSYGTTVMFEPDVTILSQTKHFFDENGGFYDVVNLIEFICMVYKNINVNIYVGKGRITDEATVGDPLHVVKILKDAKNSCKLEYVSTNDCTPVDYILKVNNIKAPIIWKVEPFIGSIPEKQINYHVEFFLTKDYTARNGNLVSAINAIQMHDKVSSQVSGAVDTIKQQLIEFIEDKDMRSFFVYNYSLPLQLITLAWNDKATFEEQRKVTYVDKSFEVLYAKALDKQFKALGRSFWDNLYTLLAEDIEVKYHKYNSRGLNIGGSMKNLAYQLNKPGSYCACRLKDPEKTELFIVEGDSAMTTIKQICDRECQAIIMLGGKPMNPFKKDASKVRNNLTNQDMIRVLGVGPGDKDLRNLNFSKIGILADADADGYHISALVLGILYNINPLILTEGKVFLSTPPLYIMANKIKHKSLFVRDKTALMDARSEITRRFIDMKVMVGDKIQPLNDEEFRAMYYLINKVGVTMTQVEKRLAIDPGILEMLIHCIPYLRDGDVDTKSIAKRLNLDYCKYIPENNSLVMTVGVLEYVVPLNNVVNDIRAYIMPELGPLAFDKVSLLISTKLTDLYKDQSITLTGIYQIFKDIDELFTTSRMKGLGQMPKQVLRQTCLDKSTRSFVTISSLGDVEEIFSVLGVDTRARKDLVSQYVGGEDDEFLF